MGKLKLFYYYDIILPDNIRSLGFGAGMGLPNMKRYTDYMQIDSVVGEGTTITMRVNF